MYCRFKDAHAIWHNGASNPRGVARALVTAIDAATESGSAGADDPAVHLILDHLCSLCGLPQPSFQAGDWNRTLHRVRLAQENPQLFEDLTTWGEFALCNHPGVFRLNPEACWDDQRVIQIKTEDRG